MKYTKMLWLLAVAAAALMVFAGIASATEITSPKGTKLPVGTKMNAEASGAISMTGSITITCQKASGEGEITNAGGPSSTVKGLAVFGTYSECGSATVTVVKTGTAELHSIGNNTGMLTASGTEVTVLLHIFLLGTVHCTYTTSGTTIGTVTGSGHKDNPTTTATLDILAAIPMDDDTSSSSCGEQATLEGTAVLTTPDHLYID